MRVVVVELPSRVRTASGYPGEGCRGLAALRHARDLRVKAGSAGPGEDFALTCAAGAPARRSSGRIGGPDGLVLATASDREGAAMYGLGDAGFCHEGRRGARLPSRCPRRFLRNGKSTQRLRVDTFNSLKTVSRLADESFHGAHT